MAGPYGEPTSAKIFDLINNARDYAEGCNVGLGCAIASNSIYIKNPAGVDAIIPELDLSVLIDTSLGHFKVILPPLADGDHNIELVKISSDANNVKIACADGDTFVGGVTFVHLYSQNDFIDLLANSSVGVWAVRGFRQNSPSGMLT